MTQFHVGFFGSSEFQHSQEEGSYTAPWTHEMETVFLSLLAEEHHASRWLPSIVENNRRLIWQ